MAQNSSLETGTLESQLEKAEALASGVIVVNHGATASTARPTTHASVIWVGSVSPTNATEFDLYLDTAGTTVVGFAA